MTDLLITGKAKLSLQDSENEGDEATDVAITCTVALPPGEFAAAVAGAIEHDADLAATLVQELIDYGLVPNTKAFAQELFEYYRYRTGGPSCPDFVAGWLYATLGKVPG